MEKLQLCALMPFRLYMPYSTLFVQENASKDKIIQVHKISPLARFSPLAKCWQSSSKVSPSAKFRSKRPNFAISEYFVISEVASERFRHQRTLGNSSG